jgi:hypothetical protein
VGIIDNREREIFFIKATEFHLHFFLEFDSVNMEYDILMEFESYNICVRIAFEVKFFPPKRKNKKKKNPLKSLRFLEFLALFFFSPKWNFSLSLLQFGWRRRLWKDLIVSLMSS